MDAVSAHRTLVLVQLDVILHAAIFESKRQDLTLLLVMHEIKIASMLGRTTARAPRRSHKAL
jgi:uncharacterized membrane protein